MNIKICDRCGNGIEDDPARLPSNAQIRITGRFSILKMEKGWRLFDLCEECFEELKRFLKK